MKKYLLIIFSFCLAFISTELFGQNSVVVTAFFDDNLDGIDNEGVIADNIPTTDLILWQDVDLSGTVSGADVQFTHTEGPLGVYTFDNGGAGLPDGDYILQYLETPWAAAGDAVLVITQLNVGGPTTDNDVDPILGTSAPFNVSGGAMEVDIDLGVYFALAIGDFVWEDLDGNGLQDAGEPGIDGVLITLLDGTGAPAVDTDGVLVPAQNTMGGGNYVFGNLPQGQYIVEFSLPTNGGLDWYPTTFEPAPFSNDSDADPTNMLRSPIYDSDDGAVISQIINNPDIDAGFFVVSSIGDLVFCDRNGNGIYDPGGAFPESGVGAGAIGVQLVDGAGMVVDDVNGVPLTTTTDGAGNYMFDLVRPGEYRVEFLFNGTLTDAAYEFTFQDDPNALGDDTVDSDVDPNNVSPTYGMTDLFTVTSNDMEHEMNIDAGIFKPFNISGLIWLDQNDDNINTGEGGPSGVLIELFQDGNKLADFVTSAGEYQFLVPPGTGYQLLIGGANFEVGGGLTGLVGCDPFGDAGDMVDNDDNGSNTDPNDVTSTIFDLIGECADNNDALVDYIDFCFLFNCNEPNDLASTACDDIPDANFICETPTLGTFCAIMPTANSPGTQPQPLCPDGGTAHNITWFAFVAYAGSYDIVLSPTGCTSIGGNDPGVQIGLYTDCTFTDEVFCQSGCSTDPVTISSTVLTPGQTYYWFIDGCFGSVCSYEVDVNGSPEPPNLTPSDVCIVDPATGSPDCFIVDPTYCPNTDVTFEVTGLDLTVEFNWTVTTLLDGPYDGESNPTSEDIELILTFENEGVYEVCLQTVDNGCQVWNGPICKQITIEGIDDEEFADQTICLEDLAGFDTGVFDPDDPNGDGTSGWQDPTAPIDFGTNIGMVTTPDGCMYEQEFELMSFPESDQGVFELTVCEDELPFMVDALEITELSFAGTLIFDLQDYQIVNASDVNGCDTTADITIELLDIQGGEFLDDLICVPEGIIMEFGYLAGISTEEEFITWEWFDINMNPLPDDWISDDPLNNIAPVDIGSGTYTLVGTIDKNGKMCSFTYTIDIDFDDFLPVTPTVEDPTIFVCESDSLATYTPTDFGDAFQFNWDFPNDVASTSTSGSFDEILTINWSGSAGGTVSLTTVNGCGESEMIEFEVTVVPQAVPSFDVVAEVCVDSCSNIQFMGDATDIASFTWDFAGGTIQNGTGGTGPGPHCVSWSDDGDKTVTLIYEDNNGCVSLETMEIISVTPPLSPPLISCNSQLGEVIFTWDVIPGTDTTDYDVTVISGQSGTLVDNTFIVTGLDTEEQVDITLIIQTNDACVEVTTTGSCIAQDCVPPDVSISAPDDVIEFCLDGNDQSFNLIENLPMGVSGTGVFMGNGIIDTLAGTFNPDSAVVGNNTISYNFFTDDGCISAAQLVLEVIETPTASFTSNMDTICVTESIEITYDGTANPNTFTWDYGVDGSGTDGANPTVSFTSAGEKMIELFVEKDGCTSESVMIPIFVQPELEPIDVFCSIQDLDQVEFSWNDIVGATGYLVSINGGVPFETTDTSWGETGLDPDEVVTISVTVLTDSRCPGSDDTQECTAVSCPTFMFSYDNPTQDVCVDGTNPTITLQANAAGGTGLGMYTWSGPNVTGDQFDPNGLAEGSYELFVTYQEDACEDSGSVIINITTAPTAAFSIDNNTICVGESVNILFEGSQLTDQVVTWTSGGEDIVAGAGDNEFVATFNDVGTFDIELQVENGDCDAALDNVSITVEPELVFDTINCVEELDMIEFSWTTVDCASEYEVFIDGVSQGTQTNTDFSVTGLPVGQEVTIEVIAVSGCACGNVMRTKICETKECTPIELSLSTMDGVQEFCISDDLAPIEILAEAMGTMGSGVGSWSGNGVDADGMFDPLTAGVGSHTIVYDFLESPGCPYQDSIIFVINDTPTVTEAFEDLTCYDQMTTNLEVIPAGGDGDYTITLNGDPADLMNDVEAGTYTILVTDGNLCTAETSVTIVTPAEPSPSIDGLTVLTEGDSSSYSINSAIFAAEVIDSIVWTANGEVICNDPGCFSIGNQTPIVTTVYEVTVHYNENCSVTTSITVEVNEPPIISVFEFPNIISPNNDGDNDEWAIVSNDENIIVNSIKIFDRWGNKVFTHDGAFRPFETTISWNGKFGEQELLPGVYVYFVEYSDQRLSNRVRSGDITLIN